MLEYEGVQGLDNVAWFELFAYSDGDDGDDADADAVVDNYKHNYDFKWLQNKRINLETRLQIFLQNKQT